MEAGKRIPYHCEMLDHIPDEDDSYDEKSNKREPCDYEDANLISSYMEGEKGIHMPVLDIDYPARLIPSSTEDHYHLYLDIPVGWEEFKEVLLAMKKAGMLQEGFVDNMIERGATFVRKPGVYKHNSPKAQEEEHKKEVPF